MADAPGTNHWPIAPHGSGRNCGGTAAPATVSRQHLLTLTDTPLIASGGVRDADDVWTLRDLGCEAVVTGKALYEKTLKLAQVIRG